MRRSLARAPSPSDGGSAEGRDRDRDLLEPMPLPRCPCRPWSPLLPQLQQQLLLQQLLPLQVLQLLPEGAAAAAAAALRAGIGACAARTLVTSAWLAAQARGWPQADAPRSKAAAALEANTTLAIMPVLERGGSCCPTLAVGVELGAGGVSSGPAGLLVGAALEGAPSCCRRRASRLPSARPPPAAHPRLGRARGLERSRAHRSVDRVRQVVPGRVAAAGVVLRD